MRCRRNFTLLEMVAVIVIIMISVGLATARIRNQTGSAAFAIAVEDFRRFIAAVRLQAMEAGADRAVYYVPEERSFHAVIPTPVERDPDRQILLDAPVDYRIVPESSDGETADDLNDSRDINDPEAKFQSTKLRWKLPEEFAMRLPDGSGGEEEASEDEPFELFRFFADGGGSGLRKLTFSHGELRETLEISNLSGRLKNVSNEEPSL